MAYEAGNVVRVRALFSDQSGNPVDPAAVFFRVVGPTLNATYQYLVAPQLVRDAAGAYHVDLDTTAGAGGWSYRFYSTGGGQASKQGSFVVTADNPL